MAYTYHGTSGWIKQPNRIVKTFDSGLCLIQQDYIRRKDKVEYFTFKQGDALSVADSQPCIDGAFIFPEPDYQDMGNGYIKCTITAYGRVNTTGSVTTRKEPVALTAAASEYKQGISLGTCQTTGQYSFENPVALYSPATTITATSISSSTFTFTGGANYAVLQSGCVLQQLQVNKTDVLIKQASTTITSFTTAQPAVIGQVVSGLTPNTTYAISVTCANNYYVDSETIQVTTISA